MSAEPAILVVSEKKLVRATLVNALEKIGMTDIRVSEKSADALAMLKQRPADVVVTEWMMSELNGLELCSHIKKMDQERFHYTAVLLYSARDNDTDIVEAFQYEIHDFISKPVQTDILAARLHAAARVALSYNSSTRAEITAVENQAQVSSILDDETGLWNQQYLNHQLKSMLKSSETRDYSTCVAIIGIDGYDQLMHSYGTDIATELVTGLASCIQSNIRPLDVIARISQNTLAVAMHSNDATFDDQAIFMRIVKSASRKTIKTSAGNIAITVSIGMESYSKATQTNNANKLIDDSLEKMLQARHRGGNRLVA